ncbi:MAG: UDP-N-acetylglucosamine--N-acetylmuramyl-(pentapeptide) pyrophosphoryl-undecaprenol N-acetylglucosamine transferase [Chlamydiota bacterium]
MASELKVLMAVGGSGGHLFPAQQLSECLLKGGNCSLFFAGYKLAETPFFQREGIAFQEISSAQIKKIGPFLFSAWKGFWQSVRLLRSFSPDVVVGFGSYHSFPVLLAAALMRKKIVLFEANCILGKVNRLLIPFAEKIALQLPLPKKVSRKEIYVPLLPWVEPGIKKITPQEARLELQLQPDVFTILVFGGSQGASFLNFSFPEIAVLLKSRGLSFQVIHLTGKEEEKYKAHYALHAIGARVKTFEKEMSKTYLAADIAICRSGAGTTAELIRFQKPALLIPFPEAADDHQKKNGEYLAALGGARLLLQQDAAVMRQVTEIEALIQERQIRSEALGKIRSSYEGKPNLSEIVREVGEKK